MKTGNIIMLLVNQTITGPVKPGYKAQFSFHNQVDRRVKFFTLPSFFLAKQDGSCVH
jgi:hypothetical protein